MKPIQQSFSAECAYIIYYLMEHEVIVRSVWSLFFPKSSWLFIDLQDHLSDATVWMTIEYWFFHCKLRSLYILLSPLLSCFGQHNKFLTKDLHTCLTKILKSCTSKHALFAKKKKNKYTFSIYLIYADIEFSYKKWIIWSEWRESLINVDISLFLWNTFSAERVFI